MGMPRRITRSIGALAFVLAALTATDAHAAVSDSGQVAVVEQDSGVVSLRTKEERTKEERTKEERTKEERTKEE